VLRNESFVKLPPALAEGSADQIETGFSQPSAKADQLLAALI
jgi:hypothetical protein